MSKLVVGNLKMNISSRLERERYFSLLKKELADKKLRNTEIVLCPPYVHLESFSSASKKISVGAQNMFWEIKGSFTGEVSPLMLKGVGCEYVILGHSERRRYFCERNEDVNLKVMSALKNGIRPIICLGETKAEKDAQQTLRVISRQIKEILNGINRTKAESIVITYEPVWAVGSDIVPTTHEIMEARVLIRKILVEIFDKKYAEKIKILYGGSVSSQTAKQVCVNSGMDGVLVGRESLIPHELIRIAEIING